MYRIMDDDLAKRIEGALIGILSDGLNRSLGALEKARTVDLKKMRKGYKGIGSRTYDIVTEQLEYTAHYGKDEILKIIREEIEKHEKTKSI